MSKFNFYENTEKNENFRIRVDFTKGEAASKIIPSNISKTRVIRQLTENFLDIVIEEDRVKRNRLIDELKTFLDEVHSDNNRSNKDNIDTSKKTLRISDEDIKPIIDSSNKKSTHSPIVYDDDL